ncbi:MAG: energy transducer TonB [Alphaproteobacteria bacterium]
MYRGAIYSALLHGAVLAVAYFGLPEMFRSDLVIEQPVPVEVVMIAEVTNAPPPQAEPEPPKPEPPKPKSIPEPPKPQPVKAPEPPKPKPSAEPFEPAVAAIMPSPKPTPTTPPEVKKIKPRRKPPPPDPLASVLRTLEKLMPKIQQEAPPQKEKRVAAVPQARPQPAFDPAQAVTVSEKDAIRRHFERCWLVPAGARDAKNLVVAVHVWVNPDGRVHRAEIVNVEKMRRDPFYRAAAESALRAVLNPKCRSLKDLNLPARKYDQWKYMTITFNPKEMIGA